VAAEGAEEESQGKEEVKSEEGRKASIMELLSSAQRFMSDLWIGNAEGARGGSQEAGKAGRFWSREMEVKGSRCLSQRERTFYCSWSILSGYLQYCQKKKRSPLLFVYYPEMLLSYLFNFFFMKSS
jgi:hypothetical protein